MTRGTQGPAPEAQPYFDFESRGCEIPESYTLDPSPYIPEP
jgi:hypothetical protein